MIKRIIGYLMLLFLFIALVLKLAGVNELNSYNYGYLRYLRYVTMQFDQWKEIKIPTFPTLEVVDPNVWYLVILSVVQRLANGIINIINFAIEVQNFIDSIFLFLAAVVKCIFVAPDIIVMPTLI